MPTDKLITDTIKELQQEQLNFSLLVSNFNNAVSLDKKQKDERNRSLKYLSALNELIKNILKYQKVQNDLIVVDA